MVAVRNPVDLLRVLVTVRARALLAYGDHGVEEALGLVHRLRQATHVGVRDVALERRRRDPVDRQRAQEEHVAAERLSIRRQDGAAVPLDCVGQRTNVGRHVRHGEIARRQIRRSQRHPFPLARCPTRLPLARHPRRIARAAARHSRRPGERVGDAPTCTRASRSWARSARACAASSRARIERRRARMRATTAAMRAPSRRCVSRRSACDQSRTQILRNVVDNVGLPRLRRTSIPTLRRAASRRRTKEGQG